MEKIRVFLEPIWEENHVGSVHITLEGIPSSFCFHQIVFDKKFCELEGSLDWKDAEGDVPYENHMEYESAREIRWYTASRPLAENAVVQYTVKLEPVGRNPVFDLGYEDGGMTGTGFTFLPGLPKGHYNYEVLWNLAHMPEGSKAAWSKGALVVRENAVTEVGTISGEEGLLQRSVYMAGNICSVEDATFGFYWLENPDFQGEEIARWTMQAYRKMAEAFNDEGTAYRIFARKGPARICGGMALHRSYIFIYRPDDVPSLDSLKFLFTHEMAHNWPTMEDEPYGVSTWYVEGTAEYYSLVLPWKLGIVSDAELKEQLREKAKDYYPNPTIHYPNERCGELFLKDNNATVMPYGRGLFYMMETDAWLRAVSGGRYTLDTVVNALLERTRAGESCYNQNWLDTIRGLMDTLAISGEEKEALWKEFRKNFMRMQNGEIIPPCTACFGGRYGEVFDEYKKRMDFHSRYTAL